MLNGALEENPKYTGQTHDIDTDLYYYNARYYDPTLGRFLQADSVIPNVFQAQTINPYAYVLNNPLKYTDPTGHYIFIPVGPADNGEERNPNYNGPNNFDNKEDHEGRGGDSGGENGTANTGSDETNQASNLANEPSSPSIGIISEISSVLHTVPGALGNVLRSSENAGGELGPVLSDVAVDIADDALSLRGGLKYTKAAFDLASNIGTITRDGGLSYQEKFTLIVLQTQRSITTLGFGWVGYFAGSTLVGFFTLNPIFIAFGAVLGVAVLSGGVNVIENRLIENLRREFLTD